MPQVPHKTLTICSSDSKGKFDEEGHTHLKGHHLLLSAGGASGHSEKPLVR